MNRIRDPQNSTIVNQGSDGIYAARGSGVYGVGLQGFRSLAVYLDVFRDPGLLGGVSGCTDC